MLVGAGHAHLHLLHQSALLRSAGVRLTLVAPRTFHYSGLATGVLSGALAPETATIDVAALADSTGVDYRPGRVMAIDRAERRLLLEAGESLSFDAVSLNLGSEASVPATIRPEAGVWSVKPLDCLFALRDAIEDSVRNSSRSPTVVVAGGGQTGYEVAAAITGLLGRLGLPAHVFLASRGAPAWGPPEALRRLHRVMTDRGVTIIEASVAERGTGYCRLSDGQRLPCDHLVWATGLRPPPLVAALGLPLSADSRLRVTPSLCSIADEGIFGVGDCAVLDHAPRPTAGVFGVRAAPVLLNNLAALADGRPVRRFNPQRTWLSIMDLGDDRGLAIRGGLWSLGRPALRLKRYLDLGFIRRVRAPDPAEKEISHDLL